MAENTTAEKTEQPTPRRLQKAREKGQVPHSQELTSVVTLLILVAVIALFGSTMQNWFEQEMEQGMSCENSVFADSNTFISFFNGKLLDTMLILLPVFGALAFGAIFASVAISGLNFSTETINLKFNQLNPVDGLKKLFNMRSLVRLVLSILKLLLISLIVWFYIRSKLEALAELRWVLSEQIIPIISRLILGLMIRIGIGLLIIASIDVIYQKWKYIQDLKMTRQEVKRDHKDTEVSPELKRRIRRIQFEMALKRTLQEVPKATVVLVNPTHYAVALKYDAKTMDAPVLVAKGADHVAEKIREVARAYGVPIISRPELTRTIYASIEPGNAIPENLFVAIAKVLAMIYRLRNKKK
ncbi:flagellar biosynthesis protein FlhB [Planctomycetota bacterium]